MIDLKRNKKGFLLAEETLKILVAVICIFFLVYILVAVYNSHSSDKKMQEAKEVLSRIENITSLIKEGGSESQDIANPDGWHLYSFVEQEKPNYCVNTNCLCICEKPLIEALKSKAKKCDEKGVCLIIPNLAMTKIDIKIRNPSNLLFIEIKKQNGKIFVEERK
jgi:hypothetical protein